MKLFWTPNKEGVLVLRDLEKESISFSRDAYFRGEFDSFNYMYYENFNHYVHDDIGCDYERYGCYIMEGDRVLDIGANIGIFSHRAELRGASEVVCFEPLSLAYECLKRNAGQKTKVNRLGVSSKRDFLNFSIHTDYTHIGGGSILPHKDVVTIFNEYVNVIGINEVFSTYGKFDFIKLDIEGGEVDLINAISDENLSSCRCFAMELHGVNGVVELQDRFVHRMNNLGFKQFVLQHNGGLRTINFWKI
jgi:FkbM family methyltransferase